MSGQIHELTHGVSGFEYHNNLESARTGDGIHVPGACTDDHSYLQVHAQLFFFNRFDAINSGKCLRLTYVHKHLKCDSMMYFHFKNRDQYGTG